MEYYFNIFVTSFFTVTPKFCCQIRTRPTQSFTLHCRATKFFTNFLFVCFFFFENEKKKYARLQLQRDLDPQLLSS